MLLKCYYYLLNRKNVVFIYEESVDRDFNSLSPHDVKGNCKKAFDAGDTLGIPRVIEPSDMDMLAGTILKLFNKTFFSI